MEQSTQSQFKPVNFLNNTKLENKFFSDYIHIITDEMNPISVRYDNNADINDVADLIVMLPYGSISIEKAVAFRVRNFEYYDRYKEQFTLREAELKKILSGKGDYYLYGFCDKEKRKLIHWTLFDLDIFRKRYNEFVGSPMYDIDGTKFFVFWFWKFKEEMIIKQF